MNIKELNEAIDKALNEEYLGFFMTPMFDLPTGIVNAFYRGNMDIETIYERDDVQEWLNSMSDKELDDSFYGLFADYDKEEDKFSRREKELKLLEENIVFAYEDDEREPDYNEEEFTDRIDANFDISLFEYGIVRNPKDNTVLFGEKPNGNTGLYEDYSYDTISYDDVKAAIEEMPEGFFEFADSTKEKMLAEITPEHLTHHINIMNVYNGKFHESVPVKKSGKKVITEKVNTGKLNIKELNETLKTVINELDDETAIASLDARGEQVDKANAEELEALKKLSKETRMKYTNIDDLRAKENKTPEEIAFLAARDKSDEAARKRKRNLDLNIARTLRLNKKALGK